MGVEVLGSGEHRTGQRRTDRQLHRCEAAAQGDTECDADEEDRKPGGQPRDGLGARTRVEDLLEEQDRDVGG